MGGRQEWAAAPAARPRGYGNWLSVQDPQETPTEDRTQCTSRSYFNNMLGSPASPRTHRLTPAGQPQSLLSQTVPTCERWRRGGSLLDEETTFTRLGK